jgi:hypothetical protein
MHDAYTPTLLLKLPLQVESICSAGDQVRCRVQEAAHCTALNTALHSVVRLDKAGLEENVS